MIRFWKWLALSTATTAAAYGGIVALTSLSLPWKVETFDTQAVTTTQPGWNSEARYFVLNRNVLSERANRIVVLGASNARDPFRPGVMEPLLPGWRVANVSLSGAGIGEIADAVDLYYAQRPPEAGRTVFVLGLSYLQFLPVNYGNGHNPLVTEALRSGLYEQDGGKLSAIWPEPVFDGVAKVLRPQAVAASLPRRMVRSVFANPDLPMVKSVVDRFRGDDPLSVWTRYIADQKSLDTVSVPAEMQQALLAQRLAGMGGDHAMPSKDFERLAALIATVRARGDAVVIADLPLPEWHRSGVPVTDGSYLAALRSILAPHEGDPAVALVSLRDFDANENFFDSGHTEPRLWPQLSRRLAQALAASPVLQPTPAPR